MTTAQADQIIALLEQLVGLVAVVGVGVCFCGGMLLAQITLKAKSERRIW